MYHVRGGEVEVLLVHPGGPLWAKKDLGAWSIPKGEVGAGEELLLTAQREFAEETGIQPQGEYIPLGAVQQKAGKAVYAWAFEGDCDPHSMRSNTFTLQQVRGGTLLSSPARRELPKALDCCGF